MRFEDIIIDEEFASEIPDLTGNELKQLEENILKVSEVTESLKVWNNILIDGHNRYLIIKKHPGLKYTIKKLYFDNREQVRLWIYRNQLGRRNLTKEQKTYLLGKQYELEKTARGGLKSNGHDVDGKFTATHHFDGTRCEEQTSERIARENNTSKATVERAGLFVRGLEDAERIEPGIKSKVLNGELKVSQKQVMDIGKADKSEKEQKIQDLMPVRKRKTSEERRRFLKMCDDLANPNRENNRTMADIIDELHVRMEDPIENLIFIWMETKKEYSQALQTIEAQENVRKLAQEGIDFLEKIKAGELWNS